MLNTAVHNKCRSWGLPFERLLLEVCRKQTIQFYSVHFSVLYLASDTAVVWKKATKVSGRLTDCKWLLIDRGSWQVRWGSGCPLALNFRLLIHWLREPACREHAVAAREAFGASGECATTPLSSFYHLSTMYSEVTFLTACSLLTDDFHRIWIW